MIALKDFKWWSRALIYYGNCRRDNGVRDLCKRWDDILEASDSVLKA